MTVSFEPERQAFLSHHTILQNLSKAKSTSKGVSRYYLWGMRWLLLQSYSVSWHKVLRGTKVRRDKGALKQDHTYIQAIIAGK
jgi:hypothetical protein